MQALKKIRKKKCILAWLFPSHNIFWPENSIDNGPEMMWLWKSMPCILSISLLKRNWISPFFFLLKANVRSLHLGGFIAGSKVILH